MSLQDTASVIICVYTEERWGDILAAVASCESQSEKPEEVIVVVDHNPALLVRLSQHFPQHRVIPNREGRGLSGGRNTGIAAATSTLVAFLDDDAIADRRWLELLKAHCAEPLALGAGSRVEPMWEGARARWFPDEFLWVVGCTYRGTPTVTAPMRNLMGGCMCVPRAMFDQIGGFHAELGRGATSILLSCEETELCIRANKRFPGRHFIYEPAAFIGHKVPAKRVTWKYLRSRCYAEGVSKALLATLAGTGDGLSAERNYTLKVLPRGVLRGVGDAIFRADPWGMARAFAIGLGFVSTVAGYIHGRARFRSAVRAMPGSGMIEPSEAQP